MPDGSEEAIYEMMVSFIETNRGLALRLFLGLSRQSSRTALPAAIDSGPSSSVFCPILPGWWNWQTR